MTYTKNYIAMQKLIIIPVIILLMTSCDSKQVKINPELEIKEVQLVLTDFFDALAGHDWNKLKSLTTEDMILVEHGLLWNNDSLINAMEKHWKEYDINYSFDFIKTQVNGNTAWTVYRNHGIASNQEREIHLHWIETVIFTKTNGHWKLIEAQSTREKEPEIIEKTMN